MEPALLHALQQLVAEGKTPTTALLKNRVAGQYPLPKLISAIKQFNANPNLAVEAAPAAAVASAPSSVAELEQRIASMQQQIDQMAAQIAQLLQQR